MVTWLYLTHKSSQIYLSCSLTNRCTTTSKAAACGLPKLPPPQETLAIIICAIISLPTFLIMTIKHSKLLFILDNSTPQETLNVPYSVQLFISSTKSTLEIQHVSDLISIRHNRSQMESIKVNS